MYTPQLLVVALAFGKRFADGRGVLFAESVKAVFAEAHMLYGQQRRGVKFYDFIGVGFDIGIVFLGVVLLGFLTVVIVGFVVGFRFFNCQGGCHGCCNGW
jgi:hypothetical protein